MNTLESYSTEGPSGTLDVCAKFIVDTPLSPFVLHKLMVPGNKYSLGFAVKGDSVGKVLIAHNSIPVTTEWTEHDISFTAKKTDLQIIFSQTGTFYIHHIKLEKGDKATDWTIAPEDTDERITETETALRILSNQIDLTVKEKDLTGNYLIGKINLTSTTALISAKNVDLEGYVTISDLKNEGKTVINGSNITTGIISADRIDTKSLMSKQLTATNLTIEGDSVFKGKLEGATGDFSGKIIATSGRIGFLDILSDSIYGANMHLYAGDSLNGACISLTNSSEFPGWHTFDMATGYVINNSDGSTHASFRVQYQDDPRVQLAMTYKNNLTVLIDGKDGTLRLNNWEFSKGSNDAIFINTGGVGLNLLWDGQAILDSWISTKGPSGWYNQTFDGGWYMVDTYWVRSYNDKSVYTGGQILAADAITSNLTFRVNGVDTLRRIAYNSTFEHSWKVTAAGNFNPYSGTASDPDENTAGEVNIGNTSTYIKNLYYGGSLSKQSDRRLKNDLGDLDMVEAYILLSESVIKKFTYKNDKDSIVNYGVYAQDLRDTLDVSGIGYNSILGIDIQYTDGVNTTDLTADEDIVSYTVDYTQYVPVLVSGWQYHDQRIEDIIDRIKMLEERVN